ncbi:MAG: hypothetical protein JW959_10320 [Pirellulales bacterium]|nr:hypothetical protein [Pirellulales bacterium]
MPTSDNNAPTGQGRAGDDEYGLRIEPESPRPETAVDLNAILGDVDSPSQPPDAEDESQRRAPPPRADMKQLFSGDFLFPFGLDALSQTLFLMFAASVLTGMIRLALAFGGAGVGWFGGAGVAAGSMLMCALAGVWLLICIAPASAWGLTVLHTTAYGGENVESWPNLIAFEGFADAVYFAAAALAAAIPGAIAASLVGRAISGVFLIAIGEFFFFPAFLLSMLENDTPLNPFSKAIWGSVFSQWRAWGVFHALTLALAGLVVLTFSVSRPIGPWSNAIAVGCVVGAGWMFYFRLLGRLARYCSLRSMERDEDELEYEDDVKDR